MPIYTHLYIREQAIALIEDNDITDPPVDVVEIADSLGIEIMEMTNDLWFYGVLSRYEENFYIIVNKLMPETRKRYAIAHEIGHFQLHGHGLEFQRAADDDYRHREADIFAEELCIPTNMLKRTAADLMNNHKVLARMFNVSEPLMVKRMEDLKLLARNKYDWDFAGWQSV
jgi:Zn-dependent peptidase ImmA (M78 family)